MFYNISGYRFVGFEVYSYLRYLLYKYKFDDRQRQKAHLRARTRSRARPGDESVGRYHQVCCNYLTYWMMMVAWRVFVFVQERMYD